MLLTLANSVGQSPRFFHGVKNNRNFDFSLGLIFVLSEVTGERASTGEGQMEVGAQGHCLPANTFGFTSLPFGAERPCANQLPALLNAIGDAAVNIVFLSGKHAH